MSDFVVVNDPRGDVFRHVLGFDVDADVIWFRFNSTADMCRLAEGIVPHLGSTTAFLLKQDFNGPSNPRLSEFQGAYGRAKLYDMNKNKVFRRRLEVEGNSFFLDGAPVRVGEDLKEYLRVGCNESFGFLIGGSDNPGSLIDGALGKDNSPEFLSHIIDNCGFAGLFLKDHLGGTSMVLAGRALSHSITSAADWTYQTPDSTLVCVRAYGDRLVNWRQLETVLRCKGR